MPWESKVFQDVKLQKKMEKQKLSHFFAVNLPESPD